MLAETQDWVVKLKYSQNFAPAPTLKKGISLYSVHWTKRKISEQWKTDFSNREKKKAQHCRNHFAEKLMTFPFPGQVPCCHAAPLSQVCSMFVAQRKRKKRHKHVMQAGYRCLLTAGSQSYSILQSVCVWVCVESTLWKSYLAGVEWMHS